MRAIFVAGVSILWSCLNGFAHSDPGGDIHPAIQAENGNFVIYFRNFAADDPPPEGQERNYRMVYSSNGKLLAPRHPWPQERPPSSGSSSLRETVLNLGDEKIRFTEKGEVSYIVERNGESKRHELAWPESTSYVDSAVADKNSIAFASTVSSEKDLGNTLALFHFIRGSDAAPKSVVLGHVCLIYSFPVASKILKAKGRYWIAYMEPSPGRSYKPAKAVLASWAPGEARPALTYLAAQGFGNSSIDIAAIGDRLCIAYHCVPEKRRNHHAEIVTVFLKIP